MKYLDVIKDANSQEELQKEIMANPLADEMIISARRLLNASLDIINAGRTKKGKPIFLRIAMVVKVDQPENYRQIN
jgi:hypothetical protein